MSYTPPQYVDTKAQAILALASVVADEDKTALGDGSVNRALDVLADAMAAQDVQVPQTNAGAILALAQYIGGGGGDFGAPVSVSFYDGTTIDESYVSEVRIPFGSEDYFTTNWDPDIIMGVPSGTDYWFITNTVVPSPGVPSGVKAFVVVIDSQIDPVELQVVPDGENTYRVSVPKLEEIEGESYGLNIYVLTA